MYVFQAGENIYLYVTVYDGDLMAKTEVWVNILNSTASTLSSYNGKRPPFLPAFNPRPPPSISNNPPPIPPGQQPYFHPKPYLDLTTRKPIISTTKKPNTTHLLPVTFNDVNNDIDNYSLTTRATTITTSTTTAKRNYFTNEIDAPNETFAVDQPVKSVPDLTVTLVPVISVCVIFLIVGGIALIFRKKICLGRTKSAKDDMVSLINKIKVRLWPRFNLKKYIYLRYV